MMSKLAYVKSNPNVFYIPKKSRRIWLNDSKPRNHVEVHDFISNLATKRWNMGIPTTKMAICDNVRVEFGKNKSEFTTTYLNSEDNKKLLMFVTRSLGYCNFTSRTLTVSQKVPMDWKNLSIAGAERARETFLKNKINVLLVAADETFLRFHEAPNKVVAPKGSKRVGLSIKCDDKTGCTVMITMEAISSQLLPPFIIFKGICGAVLMKQWQSYEDATVVLTKNQRKVKPHFKCQMLDKNKLNS